MEDAWRMHGAYMGENGVTGGGVRGGGHGGRTVEGVEVVLGIMLGRAGRDVAIYS